MSFTDTSPNISLSLMDQKGFTNLYDSGVKGEDRIALYYGKGARYLVCQRPMASCLSPKPLLDSRTGSKRQFLGVRFVFQSGSRRGNP